MVEDQKVTIQRTRGVIPWEGAFLKALEETGVISKAAKAANVSRKTVWLERQNNPQFAQDFEDTLKAGALLLEAEAIRRAHEGLLRKKFTKAGVPIIDPATGEQYVELEYSDTLLLALLKRNFPEYKDKPTEVNVTAQMVVMDASRMKALQERSLRAEEEVLKLPDSSVETPTPQTP